MALGIKDLAHVHIGDAPRLHGLAERRALRGGVGGAVFEVGGICVLVVGVLAGHGEIAVVSPVSLDLIAQRGVVRRHGVGLAHDILGGVGHGVEFLEQRVGRDDDLVHHRTVKKIQVAPGHRAERGGAPGGVVAEHGLQLAEDLTARDALDADLGEGGEVAVLVVGVALLRQQDGRCHQDQERAGKEQGHRPLAEFFHSGASSQNRK